MPRLPRFCPPGYPVHILQRGNNRRACFTSDADMAVYAKWVREGLEKYNVSIHAWVFMTNHIHLLVTPSSFEGISRLMQFVGRQYVPYFNYRYSRTGTLFEGRFKSSVVQSTEYFLNCLQYIELNPVRAGMTRDPGDYHWSSYRAHAFGTPARMWNPHHAYMALGKSPSERQEVYRQLIGSNLSSEVIQKIRHCLNTGLVLGTETFRREVEGLRN